MSDFSGVCSLNPRGGLGLFSVRGRDPLMSGEKHALPGTGPGFVEDKSPAQGIKADRRRENSGTGFQKNLTLVEGTAGRSGLGRRGH